MRQHAQRHAKEDAREQLISAIVELGYPEEFGEVLAQELGGEASMRRMASYVRQAQPSSPEEIADEMLAILAQRQTWVRQKMSQRANDAVTTFYNRPREEA